LKKKEKRKEDERTEKKSMSTPSNDKNSNMARSGSVGADQHHGDKMSTGLLSEHQQDYNTDTNAIDTGRRELFD
jgi:hypothetical protein